MQGGTCVIVGDDDKLAAEIGEAAARLIGCEPWRPTSYRLLGGHNQSAFTHSSYDLKCQATSEMFVDEELLANADYLVGPTATTYSPVCFNAPMPVEGSCSEQHFNAVSTQLADVESPQTRTPITQRNPTCSTCAAVLADKCRCPHGS